MRCVFLEEWMALPDPPVGMSQEEYRRLRREWENEPEDRIYPFSAWLQERRANLIREIMDGCAGIRVRRSH